MAGVPHHALESYVAKLIEKGYHVAVCEQMSEPDGRGIVDREVTRVITPGTIIEPELLVEACRLSGQQLDMHRESDYDHGYFFIQSFIAEHMDWHARLLNGASRLAVCVVFVRNGGRIDSKTVR